MINQKWIFLLLILGISVSGEAILPVIDTPYLENHLSIAASRADSQYPSNEFSDREFESDGQPHNNAKAERVAFTPVTVNDTVVTSVGATIKVPVLDNDTYPPGVLIGATCGPFNGGVAFSGDTIIYTPNPGYLGLDSICYQACDPLAPFGCDTAIIHITVLSLPPLVNPAANLQPVDSGALIIAMDNVNQDDGGGNFNLLAYGLVNELLHASIPIKWIIKAGKDKDSTDFSANAIREFPTTGTPGNLDFLAGPFLIDSIYADSARQVITTYIGNTGSVNVYRLLQNTTVDVRYFLTHQPTLAVFNNGGNEQIHLDFLSSSGFSSAYIDTIQASMVGFDSVSCYTFASEPHWGANSQNDTLEIYPVRRFLENGGNFLAECEGIETYECFTNLQTNNCVSSTGINAEEYFNPDMPFLQTDGPVDNQGGSTPAYLMAPGGAFQSGTYLLIKEVGTQEFKASARKVSNTLVGGTSFYLGGHNYQPNNNANINGIRMYMNSIMVPAKRPDNCFLDFSCDVGLQKLSSQPSYCLGDTASFTIIVINNGPGIAQSVSVFDTLHPALSFVPGGVATTGSYNSATGEWSVGNMPPGQSDTLTILASVNQGGLAISNTAWATVSIYSPQKDFSNDSASVSFTLGNAVPIQISPAPQMCEGDQAVNLAVSPPGGIWTGPFLNGSAFSPDSAGTFVLSYQFTDSNGCVATDSTTILVDTLPAVDLPGDTTLCLGSSYQLDAGVFGASYLWSTGAQSQTITVNSSNIYAVTVSSAQLCTDSDSIQVDFLPVPTINLGPDTSFCQGDTFSLSAGSTGFPVLWSTGDTTNSISIIASGMYSLLIGDSLQCFARDTINVVVNPVPVVSLASLPAEVCGTDSPISLNGIPTGGIFLGNGVNGGFFDPGSAGAGSTSITYIYSDVNGCTDSSQTVIVVRPDPQVMLSGLSPEYCILDSAQPLMFTPIGGVLAGPGIAGNSFVPSLAGTGGPYTIVYNYSDSLGCDGTDTIYTAVSPSPSDANAGPDQTANQLTGIDLNANFPAIGTGIWSSLSGSVIFSGPNSPISLAEGLSPGINTLIWTISEPPCPAKTDTMTIRVNPINIPTGFSPNGDGVNDQWIIQGLEAYSKRQLTIFSRWGSLIYSNENYSNDWTGLNNSGTILTDDTYFFILDLGVLGGAREGFVVIKR